MSANNNSSEVAGANEDDASTQTNFSDFSDNTGADAELMNISEELCDEPADTLDDTTPAEYTDKNTATLVFACGAVPSFPDEDEDGDEPSVMTDGGRDTQVVRYVEYQGDGYIVEDAMTNDLLLLTQPGEGFIEAPVEECTPTNVSGDPLDIDGTLKPRSLFADFDHDYSYRERGFDDNDDDDEEKTVMTDGGIGTEEDRVEDHNGLGFGGDTDTVDEDEDDDGPSLDGMFEKDTCVVCEEEVKKDNTEDTRYDSYGRYCNNCPHPEPEMVECTVCEEEVKDWNADDTQYGIVCDDCPKPGVEDGDTDVDGIEDDRNWLQKLSQKEVEEQSLSEQHAIAMTRGDVEAVEELDWRDPADIPDEHLPGAEIPWEWMDKAIDQEPGSMGSVILADTKGKINSTVREWILNRLEYDYSWMFMVDDEQGVEELRLYEDDVGFYMKGGERRLTSILTKNVPSADSKDETEILRKIKGRNTTLLDNTDAATFDDMLVNAKDCVINISNYNEQTGEYETMEHDPKYNFIYGLGANYDANADTSEVEKFLDEITDENRPQDKLVLEEMLGDCLTPHYRRKWVGFLHGPGDNGKSVLMNSWREMLEPANVSPVKLDKLINNNFAGYLIAREGGKLANMSAEIKATAINDFTLIKTLSGNDPEYFEGKGTNGFSELNTSKLIFAMNDPPVIESQKRAAKKRVTHIRMPYEFTYDPQEPMQKMKDPGKEAQLTTQDNLNAWLQVALNGLRRMQEAEEREEIPFSLGETREEHFDRYQMQSDTLKAFATTCLENSNKTYSDGVMLYLTKDEMYSAYKSYCNAESEKVMAEKSFKNQFVKTSLEVNKTYRPPTNHHDNTGRPPSYGRMLFTEEGMKYMPVSVKQRFADLFGDRMGFIGDDDDGTSRENDAADGRVTEYSELGDGDHVTVEGTVTDSDHGGDSMEYKVELTAPETNGNDMLEQAWVCAWESTNPPEKPAKGERVVVGAVRFESGDKWGDQLHITDETFIDVLPESDWTPQEPDDVLGKPKTTEDISTVEDDVSLRPSEEMQNRVKTALRFYKDDPVSVNVLAGEVTELNGDVEIVLGMLCDDGVAEHCDDRMYRFIGGDGQ